MFTCPACEEMNTILPSLLSIMAGRRAWVGKMEPRIFTLSNSYIHNVIVMSN